MNHYVERNGFTLIELVIIIVILGVLSVSVVPKYVDMQKDAELAAAQRFGAALKEGHSFYCALCLFSFFSFSIFYYFRFFYVLLFCVLLFYYCYPCCFLLGCCFYVLLFFCVFFLLQSYIVRVARCLTGFACWHGFFLLMDFVVFFFFFFCLVDMIAFLHHHFETIKNIIQCEFVRNERTHINFPFF